jgi:hypothetical protein
MRKWLFQALKIVSMRHGGGPEHLAAHIRNLAQEDTLS